MRSIFRTSLVMCVLAAGMVQAGTFGRFSVEADIPVGFVMGPAPGNDAGRLFADAQGGQIRVWARKPDAPLEEHRARTLDYLRSVDALVTHESSGWGWYVLAGLRDNQIFYIRVEDGLSCVAGGARATLDFSYPVEIRGRYDPLVESVAGSLGFETC